MIEAHHRHVVWDWNGTLLDDVDLCVEIVNAMLARRGRELLDRARYHAHFDFPVRLFYQRLGFDVSGAGFAEVSKEFIGEFDRRRHEAALHAGASDLLAAVTRSGRGQSILSAHREVTLHEVVDLLGIAHHFTQVAGLDDAHAHSKLERGRALVAALGIPREEIVLVGDTLHDLEVATALGVACILVSRGHHSRERLCATGARVAHSLAELAALIAE